MNHVNVADVLSGLAQSHPERPALESASLRLTWSQMIDQASRTGRALSDAGILADENVGIVLRDAAQGFLSMIALWMIGAVPVPIDFRARPAERTELAHAFDLRAILDDRPSQGVGYRSIQVSGPAWQDTLASQPSPPLLSPLSGAPAFIGLTSGTTGAKRGIVVDHDRLLMRVAMPDGLGRRDAGGKLLNPSPLAFGFSVHNTLTQLLNGGSVLFLPPVFSAREFDEIVRTRGITAICTVPTVVRALLEIHANAESPAYPEVRLFYCAGAPLSADEKRAAHRRLTPAFIETFASTVAGRISFLDSHQIASHAESVGCVLPQVMLELVDEAGVPVPVGSPGLVRVRSPGMARAFYGDPERTTGDRLRDGWVYTGDLARIDGDRFLYLMGRDSDMVIRGGENVYPAEIEAVAAEMPGIVEAAVVGFAAPGLGEDIALFYSGDAAITPDQLIAHLRARLVPNKVPRLAVRLEALPRNANGKVDRAGLRDSIGDGRSA